MITYSKNTTNSFPYYTQSGSVMETNNFFAWSCIMKNKLYGYEHLHIIQNHTREKISLCFKHCNLSYRVSTPSFLESALGYNGLFLGEFQRFLIHSNVCCEWQLSAALWDFWMSKNQIKVFKTALHTKFLNGFQLQQNPRVLYFWIFYNWINTEQMFTPYATKKRCITTPYIIVFLQNY